MNPSRAHSAFALFLDLGWSTLKFSDGRSLPLERQPSGRLTESCRETVLRALRATSTGHSSTGTRVLCGLHARGMLARPVEIPTAVPTGQRRQFLALQMEKEFPLPPDQLAWGFHNLENGSAAEATGRSAERMLIVAVKKESLEEYETLFAAAGLAATFTPGILASAALCAPDRRSWALLDLGRTHAELATFEGSVATGIRTLNWTEAASAGELTGLAQAVRTAWSGDLLRVTGGGASRPEIDRQLAEALGNGCTVQRVAVLKDRGNSSVVEGLRQLDPSDRIELSASGDTTQAPATRDRIDVWKWAAAAAVLAVATLALRYVEPITRKGPLERRVREVRAAQKDLPEIDRELGFLQYLETNQPPYLNLLNVLAESAARGTKMTTVSLNRRGELSLKATMPSPDQAGDLRTKLLASGSFQNVVIEEQTPGQNRQITVRMSAQWKPSRELRAESPPSPATASAPPGTNFSRTKP